MKEEIKKETKEEKKEKEDHVKWKKERGDKKKIMLEKFKNKKDNRLHGLVSDLAKHAVNHPRYEKGLLEEKILELENLDKWRDANLVKKGHKKQKYSDNIKDLKGLLKELDK